MPSYTCLFPFAVSWNKSWLRWNSGPIWWQGWFFFARWRLLQLRIVCKHTLLRHSTLCSALPTAWFITTVNLVFIETVFFIFVLLNCKFDNRFGCTKKGNGILWVCTFGHNNQIVVVYVLYNVVVRVRNKCNLCLYLSKTQIVYKCDYDPFA